MLYQISKSFALIIVSLYFAVLVESVPQAIVEKPVDETSAKSLGGDSITAETTIAKPIDESTGEGSLLISQAGNNADQFQVKLNDKSYNLNIQSQMAGFTLPLTDVKTAAITSGPAGIGCYLRTDDGNNISDMFFSPASASFGLISMRTFEYTGAIDGVSSIYCYKVQDAISAAHTVVIALDYIHQETGQTTHTLLVVEMEKYSALQSLYWTFTSRGAQLRTDLEYPEGLSVLDARISHNPYRGMVCFLRSSNTKFRDIGPGLDLLSPISGVKSIHCMTRDIANDMKDIVRSMNPNRCPWARGWQDNPIFKIVDRLFGR